MRLLRLVFLMTFMNSCCLKITHPFGGPGKTKLVAKRLAAEVVDGYTEPTDIANAFAVNFGNACTPNSISHNDDLEAEFETRLCHYCPVTSGKFISVELVDKMLVCYEVG